MTLELTRRRFSVDEYERMGEAGILGEDDRVELLDGEIVEMTPIGSRHAATVKRLIALFSERLGNRAQIGAQDPVWLDESSEPQPDLVLLRPRADFYAAGHPTPEDILLLVEVADTSLRVDRQVKIPLYARAGIVEIWLIDLEQSRALVHRDPSEEGYGVVTEVQPDESLAPLAFPEEAFTLKDMLP